jgi:hypothetical protein
MTLVCEVTLYELLGLQIKDALQTIEGVRRGALSVAPNDGRVIIRTNGSNSVCINIGAYRASLFLSENRTVTVYAKNGGVVLGIMKDRDVIIKTVKELHDLEKLITDFYDKSIVHCSICGCEVDYQHALAARHTIYAGTYCDSCADTDSFRYDKSQEGL